MRDAVRKRRKESAVQDQRLLVSEISPKFLTTKIGVRVISCSSENQNSFLSEKNRRDEVADNNGVVT